MLKTAIMAAMGRPRLSPKGTSEGQPRSVTEPFTRNESGVSAIEFSLVLPIMLVMFAGMAELSHAIDNRRKITLTARTISDLTAQGDSTDKGAPLNPVRSNLMNDILAAASPILRPFDSRTAKIVVSAMGVDKTNPALAPKVCSSVATQNAVARSTGIANDLTVPAGMGLPGMRYIFVEVTMPYTPMLGGAIVDLFGNGGGEVTLRANMPWPIRRGEKFDADQKYPEIILPNGVRC